MLGLMRALIASLLLSAASNIAFAEEPPRKTIWDLKLGEPLAAQADEGEFHGYACGAQGGPPRQPIVGFFDFMRCAPESNGLHEVYFEYDDELEYIARARDREDAISRYAGTVERDYPVIVSALIDDAGVVRGARMASDARADYRKDITDADLRKRESAYQLGGVIAGRFDIDANQDCVKGPRSDGESPVGGVFVKLDCEKTDVAASRLYKLSIRMLRKPGQSGRDPRLPSSLTKGQFESLARFEIFALP
jgi:hypothetical protein